MTEEEFFAATGCDPDNDDLERANCTEVGKVGHMCCGICDCGKPRFMCMGGCGASGPTMTDGGHDAIDRDFTVIVHVSVTATNRLEALTDVKTALETFFGMGRVALVDTTHEGETCSRCGK